MELPLDTVHVWYAVTDQLTNPAVQEQFERLMSDDERKRRDRLFFPKDRHAFLITRGLVRTVLARYARMAPEACVFTTNRYGKPSLYPPSDHVPLQFNVSHTNRLAAIAVSVGRDIGIDVEDVARTDVELDRCRFFSAAEVAMLQSMPHTEQKSRFFDYWTLKEAYIKARGMGLWLPLDGFSMHVHLDRPPTIEFTPRIDDDPSAWQFALFDPTPCHRMALAIRRRGADLPVWIRAFDQEFPALQGR